MFAVIALSITLTLGCLYNIQAIDIFSDFLIISWKTQAFTLKENND